MITYFEFFQRYIWHSCSCHICGIELSGKVSGAMCTSHTHIHSMYKRRMSMVHDDIEVKKKTVRNDDGVSFRDHITSMCYKHARMYTILASWWYHCCLPLFVVLLGKKNNTQALFILLLYAEVIHWVINASERVLRVHNFKWKAITSFHFRAEFVERTYFTISTLLPSLHSKQVSLFIGVDSRIIELI